MANTKVTGALIADATITATNIADGAVTAAKLTGITTTSIAEGDKLFYTDARVGTYLSTNGYDTAANIIATITDSAPVTLDTLNELAAALGDDPNYATTTANLIGTKLPLAGGTLTGGLHINTTSLPQLLIQNVDGGSNAEKIAIELNAGDIFKIRSLNDNNTTRVDNIITANILTGNVGIGTSSPSHKLTVDTDTNNDGITLNGSTANLRFNIKNDQVTSGQRAFSMMMSGSYPALIFQALDDNYGFVRNVMAIEHSGEVGINTITPSYTLDVNGSSHSINTYIDNAIFHTGDTNTYLQFHDQDQFRIVTGGVERFEVSNSQTNIRNVLIANDFVGIGTNSPYKSLEVKNSYDGSQLSLRSTSGNSGNAGLRFSIADNTVGTDAYHKASIWLTGDGTGNALGDLTFNINNVASSANVGSSDEKMRLTREGYLGIGTTNPSYGLHVANGVSGYSAGFDESIVIGESGTTPRNLRFANITGAYNTFQQGSRIFQYFPDGNGTAEASIYFNRSNGTGGGVTSGAEISFHTTKNTYGPYGRETDEERVRITQRGELRLSANSLGIQFNGDTAAGNRLDDYEEGTWNPNASHTFTHATYTKIGRVVHCQFTCTNPAGMGTIALPFAPSNTVTGSGASEQVRYTGYVQTFLSGGNDTNRYTYIWQGNLGAQMYLHGINSSGQQLWTTTFQQYVSQVTVYISFIV
jgi:hypothetical protein